MSGSPALIAVATNSSASAVAVAKKQCAAILKPRQSQAFVQALDAAIAHQKRAKTAKSGC